MLHRALLILTCYAVEFASVVEETLCAVARDTGAHSGNYLPEYWKYLLHRALLILTCEAVKLASVVEKTLGAVARDTGEHPRAPVARILEILAT